MVARGRLFAFAGLLLDPFGACVRATGGGNEAANANPIRKVVTLLESMAKKVEKEGEAEKELYEKFMCYCKTGASDLTMAISDSQAQVPAVQSDIEESQSSSAKLKQDLKRHKADRNTANIAISEATALREKEHASFVAESTELKDYVSSLAGAIPAIEAGMAGTGLLQSKAAAVAQLRRAVSRDERLTDYDRQSVFAFLAGSTEGTSRRYVPKSGEIVGILKEMKEGFDTDLAASKKKEAESLRIFQDLASAKKKEVATLTASIEKKTARVGELDLAIVRMKQELTESEAALIENQKFLKDLDADCKSKTQEMELRVKTRGEEMIAIRDTIKILSDDDALDLFKKSLPSASFMQKVDKAQAAKRQAMLLLHKAQPAKDASSDLRFLELALMGRKVDFSKVFKMIDDMVVILKQEQVDDDAKQEYCNSKLDATKDKGKALTNTIKDLEVSLDEKTTAIATLKEDLKTLNKGIVELDRLVADATQQRKQENEEFTELISNDMAAKELLAFAKNRLQKFYSPKQSKPAKKVEPSDVEFFQRGLHSKKQEPAAPPATWNTDYKKKEGDSVGVISMIDLLVRDINKEMKEAETQEEMAQKAYEELMSDSAAKRAKDVKSVQVKNSAVADNEELKTAADGELKSKKQEFMAVETYISQLHGDCDWLLQNFDLRKSARAEEMDALKQAKAVLAGANFELLQTSKVSFLSRHS